MMPDRDMQNFFFWEEGWTLFFYIYFCSCSHTQSTLVSLVLFVQLEPRENYVLTRRASYFPGSLRAVRTKRKIDSVQIKLEHNYSLLSGRGYAQA